MNFYKAFLRTLFWRPSLAIEAMVLHVSGRKVRARNRLRIGASQSPRAYALWIKDVERQPEALAGAAGCVAQWPHRPRFSVILDLTADPRQRDPAARQRDQAIAALSRQCYRDWELVLVQSPDNPPLRNFDLPRLTIVPHRGRGGVPQAGVALTKGIAAATGDFIVPLAAETTLPAIALFRYAEALQHHPGATVLYGDHDALKSYGSALRRGDRLHPWFKPRWNAEMILAQDYISPACAIATQAARAALDRLTLLDDTAAAYALLLEVATQPGPQPMHVPHVLAHVPIARAAADQAARVAAVARHVAPAGATARAGPFDTVRVDWPLPDPPPLVSIIVPTRDQARLLRTCVHGVLTQTRYPAFEIIIVDNGSTEPEALDYLAQVARNPKVRVIEYDRPFNFSAINNHAVGQARGQYICLLNNDVEIIDEGWLTALMRQAVRPGVGAAGAKLLYEDNTIQHAGVVIGLGNAAGHAHRFLRNDQPGYFAQVHVARYVSAVTAACMVVAREKFLAVGGFDEVGLAVAFNDVDLCLKLGAAGWHNVYVPQAELIHHESKSRGRDFLPANIDRYMSELAVLQSRWATPAYDDPLHHPRLDRTTENYVLRL